MQKIQWIGIATISFLMTGCATSQNYARAVNSWSGISAKKLVRVWGYPSRIERMSNGHQLYIYRSIKRGRYPTQVSPGYTSVKTEGNQTYVTSVPTTYSGGGSYDYRCKTWFEVSRGRVVNTSFRGNNCLGTDNFAVQYGYGITPKQ